MCIYIYIYIYIYMYLFIYLPRTQMTCVLVKKRPCFGGYWSSKIEASWVLGIYIYINISTYINHKAFQNSNRFSEKGWLKLLKKISQTLWKKMQQKITTPKQSLEPWKQIHNTKQWHPKYVTKKSWKILEIYVHTVDGWNPAPPGIYKTL